MPVPKKWVSQLIVMLLILGVSLLLLIGAERHLFSSLSLNIYQADQHLKKLLYSQKVTAGETVILSYIHSSDGTPVEQIFAISKQGTLNLLEERYRWYGAGLEYSSGYDLAYKDGWVCITGYDRTFDFLPIRIALTVPQVLLVAGRKIYLYDLAEPGSRLVIKIETTGFFKKTSN